jgi:hypothetical protein
VSTTNGEPTRVTCKACRRLCDAEAFFRLTSESRPGRLRTRNRRLVCIGCEIDRRTERVRADRWMEKARTTLAHHAQAWSLIHRDELWQHEQRKRLTPREFAGRFGWKLPEMAHDAEHTYVNRCYYCRTPFETMGHGLADLSLDIINPSQSPYYATNCRWACLTCNREKSTLSPEMWSRRLQEWDRHEEYKAHRLLNPWSGLPLIETLYPEKPRRKGA